MPADPYYKGVTASVGYTAHFNDFVAWEVAQFSWSFNLDTNLKKDLKRHALSTARARVPGDSMATSPATSC